MEVTSRDAFFTAPLRAAQCWADADLQKEGDEREMEGRVGGCWWVIRPFCVSVLASVWETLRHSFMR